MTYYLSYLEDGSFNGFYDETDYRVDASTMVHITEELWSELQLKRCLFVVDASKIIPDKLYTSLGEIFVPKDESVESTEVYNEPGDMEYLVDLDYRISKIELGI